MKKLNRDYYVYLLIDPRDNQVFYVGKGINLRTFQHEQDAEMAGADTESKKLKTINDIKNSGYEVKREIFSNLTESESFNLEAVLIKTYRSRNPEKMTNIQSGHHCEWLMQPEKYKDIFDDTDSYEKYVTDEKIIFIHPHRSFDYEDTFEERYEKFKGGWAFNLNKAKRADYIFVIVNHKIKYVFKPKEYVLNDRNTYDFIGDLDEASVFKGKRCDIKFPQLGWTYNYK